ncbi:hypothetical protein GCM10029992_24510 [Glycomyces albus]
MPTCPHPELVDAGIGVLRDYAARGETLTYGDLNRKLGNPFKHGGNFPGQIGRLCDDINARHEAITGMRFMFSALVHNGDTHMPGPGFFQLAARLRRLSETDDLEVKRAFVSDQLQTIYAYYRTR